MFCFNWFWKQASLYSAIMLHARTLFLCLRNFKLIQLLWYWIISFEGKKQRYLFSYRRIQLIFASLSFREVKGVEIVRFLFVCKLSISTKHLFYYALFFYFILLLCSYKLFSESIKAKQWWSIKKKWIFYESLWIIRSEKNFTKLISWNRA